MEGPSTGFSPLSPSDLHIAARDLANCLLRMTTHAASDDAEGARSEIRTIQSILAQRCLAFERQSFQFALSVGKSAAVVVSGEKYPTAHHAVYERSSTFLLELRMMLDPGGWVDSLNRIPVNSPEADRWREDSGAAAEWRVNHGLDWNTQIVADDWHRARDFIVNTLDGRWREDFQCVANRLDEEAAGSKASEPAKVNGFVANEFQCKILTALDGKALTKVKLAAEICGGEGSRLYRPGGIKELMQRGLVKNKRRLGYYRPDRPPPSP